MSYFSMANAQNVIYLTRGLPYNAPYKFGCTYLIRPNVGTTHAYVNQFLAFVILLDTPTK